MSFSLIQTLPAAFAGPADLAGLKPNDVIRKINGEDVLQTPLAAVVARMKAAGKRFALTVAPRMSQASGDQNANPPRHGTTATTTTTTTTTTDPTLAPAPNTANDEEHSARSAAGAGHAPTRVHFEARSEMLRTCREAMADLHSESGNADPGGTAAAAVGDGRSMAAAHAGADMYESVSHPPPCHLRREWPTQTLHTLHSRQ